MVEYRPKERVEAILDIILPSIVNGAGGKDFQLRLLDNNKRKAIRLNRECGNAFENLEERFAKARETIESRP